MNCVECQLSICELCAKEKKHASHKVYQQRELMSCIEQRMEALMSTYQHLENQCNSILDSQSKFHDALQQLEEHRNILKQKAKDKVEDWKKMLDESLKVVNLDIDKKFLPFEGLISE